MVGDHQLHRAPRQRRRHLGGRQARPTCHDRPLRQEARRRRVGQRRQVLEPIDRRCVGHAGDPEARQSLAHRRQVGRPLAGQAVPQPAIEAAQPARGPSLAVTLDTHHGIGDRGDVAGPVGGDARPGSFHVEPGQLHAPGVEHPLDARAVLHPDRPIPDDVVQPPAVERSGDRLVVADGAQPRSPGQRPVGGGQRAGEAAASGVAAGPTGTDRSAAASASRWMWWSCRPGNQRTAAPVDDGLAGARLEAGTDGGDGPVTGSDVDQASFDGDLAEQQLGHEWGSLRCLTS